MILSIKCSLKTSWQLQYPEEGTGLVPDHLYYILVFLPPKHGTHLVFMGQSNII